MNIATGAILQKDTEEFLLNCDTLGRSARNEFYETRLKEKSKQLLDKIPKTRKTTKKTEAKVTTDLNKETIRFLRHIDYGRLRGYDLKTLLSYEICSTSFYLTKNGLMEKIK